MGFPTRPSVASFAPTASCAPWNCRSRRTPSMEPLGTLGRVDGAPALDGAHVLVVEDDFFILAELESGLTDAGAEVVGPCRSARDALAALDGRDVAVAILDLQLGGGRSS